MPPQKFPSTIAPAFYVGDSYAYDLTDLLVDGVAVDLSDATTYLVSATIKADRGRTTDPTATFDVTFPEPGVTRLVLTPDQSTNLGTLLADVEPAEGTTALTTIAAIDVQVEVLAGGVVVDRQTLLSDDARISGDVTR